MASPMQLMECVSNALGVDLATVVSHDRNLVSAGLRTKGGRGTSAARMTSMDAAYLLIAIAGADQVRGNVVSVVKFASLVCANTRSGTPLRSLNVGHTFGEALAALIQGFADRSFHGGGEVSLDVELTRPKLHAKIHGMLCEGEITGEYLPQEETGHDPPAFGDLKVITKLSQVSLWQLGEALRI